MNELNNIIIEGAVTKVIQYGRKELTTIMYMTNREADLHYTVTASGGMGQNIFHTVKPGDLLRTVGRLAPDGEEITIIPDHVEYIPRKVINNG